MKLKIIGLAAFASLALSAGIAAAEMQPIPNPPEKPKASGKHHAKHHHHMAKKAEKAEDKAEATSAAKPK